MPPLTKALRHPLTRRFQQALSVVATNAAPAIQRAWDGLPNHDEESIPLLAARSQSAMTAAKRAAVTQSTGYYQLLSGHRAPKIDPDELDFDPTYRDPFISFWGGLKNGETPEDSLALGKSRTFDVVTNYVIASSRKTGDLFVAKADIRVAGWERVAEANACPFCEDLSNESYDSSESADFQPHDRCGCTTAPLF